MQRICTLEVPSRIGERVRVMGWLQSLRQMGGINFLVLRDGWGTLQAVAENEVEIAPLVESAAGVESVIAIEGDALEVPQAPGGVELHNLRIEVITPVLETLPVSLNKRKITANLTTLLDHAAVTNRNPERRAVLRLRYRHGTPAHAAYGRSEYTPDDDLPARSEQAHTISLSGRQLTRTMYKLPG